MGLIAKEDNGSSLPLIEEGLHVAVCYGLYDLGTIHDDVWNRDKHEVLLVFEIPGQRIQVTRDGQNLDMPRSISRKFTLSLAEKGHLRPFLIGWRGRAFTPEEIQGFDLRNTLGKGCQLQVVHQEKNGKTYANIANAVPMPKGVRAPSPENPLSYFSWADGTPIPDSAPAWIVERIKKSQEWLASLATTGHTQHAEDPVEDDDGIPF